MIIMSCVDGLMQARNRRTRDTQSMSGFELLVNAASSKSGTLGTSEYLACCIANNNTSLQLQYTWATRGVGLVAAVLI